MTFAPKDLHDRPGNGSTKRTKRTEFPFFAGFLQVIEVGHDYWVRLQGV
jgi:hypothetical protein